MRLQLGAPALLALGLFACASNAPNAENAAHARELAHRVVIVDTHIDVPYRLHDKPEDVTVRTSSGDFDFPRAFEGGLCAPFFSIYVPSDLEETGGSKAMADQLIDGVESIAARAPNRCVVATSVDGVRRAKAEGKLAILMGMENGSPIERDLANLDHFAARGVRYITLCHAKDNHVCDSSYDPRHSAKGLTPFGRDVVRRMNELGVMVDVSHVSDDTFWAVMEIAKAPAIASHSSCRHFTPDFERNMSDDMIRRLAKNGGVIQINFGSAFLRDDIRRHQVPLYAIVEAFAKEQGLRSDDPKVQEFQKKLFAENPSGYADVKDVADHIDHVAKLVGVDYVGLGSDFDGVGDSLPTGLKDVSMYPNLIAELMARGYSDEELEKICGGNLLRVMSEVERAAATR